MQNFATHPNIQQKALQKALKSPYIGKHGRRKQTLALEEEKRDLDFEKKLLKKDEDIVTALKIERSRIMNEMKNKIGGASFRDLIYGFEIITKNILLLQSKNTKTEQITFRWKGSKV